MVGEREKMKGGRRKLTMVRESDGWSGKVKSSVKTKTKRGSRVGEQV